jgi:hypothetical protein
VGALQLRIGLVLKVETSPDVGFALPSISAIMFACAVFGMDCHIAGRTARA